MFSSVSGILADAGVLEGSGGVSYIANLVDAVTPGLAPTTHGRKVRDAARRRRLLLAGHKIAQLAMVESANVEDIIDLAQQAIFDLSERHPDPDAPSVYGDLLQPMLEMIEAPGLASSTTADRVATGFEDMDRGGRRRRWF